MILFFLMVSATSGAGELLKQQNNLGALDSPQSHITPTVSKKSILDSDSDNEVEDKSSKQLMDAIINNDKSQNLVASATPRTVTTRDETKHR